MSMRGFCDNCGEDAWQDELCEIRLRWKPDRSLRFCERCGRSLMALLDRWIREQASAQMRLERQIAAAERKASVN